MTDFRKWFPILALLVALAPAAKAQGTSPDCRLDFTLTAAGNSASVDNRAKMCSTWVLAYTSTGFSALTLTIQAAPVTAAGIAGSWATATGTFTGTHPATTTTHSLVKLEAFHPFLRVNLSGLTGTGTVTGRLYGYRYSASRVVESGGSSGSTVTYAEPYLNIDGVEYGPVYVISNPNAQTFSWVNQGSATLTTSAGGAQTITAPANAASSLKMRAVTAPATPYTVTARLSYTMMAANYIKVGLGFRESGTGKITTVAWDRNTFAGADYWTNATTYGGSIAILGWYQGTNGSTWFRVSNNGTNLTYSISGDGVYFLPVATEAKTAHFTTSPDQVFFFVDTNNATYGASVTLLSWLVS